MTQEVLVYDHCRFAGFYLLNLKEIEETFLICHNYSLNFKKTQPTWEFMFSSLNTIITTAQLFDYSDEFWITHSTVIWNTTNSTLEFNF